MHLACHTEFNSLRILCRVRLSVGDGRAAFLFLVSVQAPGNGGCATNGAVLVRTIGQAPEKLRGQGAHLPVQLVPSGEVSTVPASPTATYRLAP